MKTDIPRSKLLTIESVAYGGDGVGRLSSGKVCFVPGTLPGETVSVEIVQEKKIIFTRKSFECRNSVA